MCSVWLTIPSARPVEEAEPVLKQWRERGYKVAIWRDESLDWCKGSFPNGSYPDLTWFYGCGQPYPGYAAAVNHMIRDLMSIRADANWFVTGGDDVLPHPNKSAEEIARECSDHFLHVNLDLRKEKVYEDEVQRLLDSGHAQKHPAATFGVMQCTGDRWHEGVGGFSNAPIDRVCGSPWLGREFCKRMYGGKGPLWPEFEHMFVDEHLQCVAQKLGILWQRRDLCHKHLHWGRGATDRAVVSDPVIPAHLTKWNTPEHWNESRAVFERLKAGGFAEANDILP